MIRFRKYFGRRGRRRGGQHYQREGGSGRFTHRTVETAGINEPKDETQGAKKPGVQKPLFWCFLVPKTMRSPCPCPRSVHFVPLPLSLINNLPLPGCAYRKSKDIRRTSNRPD